MKLIIDIPEEAYKQIMEFGFLEHTHGKICYKAIKNGTHIPDNDCNNCEKAWTDKCERAECYENNYKYWTPYQKVGE